MTHGNNLIMTVFGMKNDGKTTLGLYYLEMLNRPSIIIDVTEQFQEDRKYRKIVRGVQALRYELINNKDLFMKGKFQLIFRPKTSDITKEVEAVIQTVLDEYVEHINIFFDELEIYADNYLTKKSSIYQLYYISRNRKINIIAVVKVIGMVSRLIRAQTDYFAMSQITDNNSRKYFMNESEGKIKEHLRVLGPHEFLVTDLKKYFKKFKLQSHTIKALENKKK